MNLEKGGEGADRIEIDPVTGHPTTGHVWDGIRELNRPLPRWWLWTFYATIIFSLAYVVLYPAIPLLSGGTGGVLDYSARETVEGDIALARQAQAGRLGEIATLPLEEIKASPDLNRFAIAGGRSAFLVNCIQCHGTGAAGSPGYANLNDDDWLWGGSLEDIYHTIAYGIRSDHADTRFSEMPAFGGMLTRPEIVAVANYVLSLSGEPHDEALAAQGADIYNKPTNCAACHGANGEGSRKDGAPRLNDAIVLKAGTLGEIVAQIANPKHGVMPAWTGRLNDTVVKELALYVHSLGGGEAAAP
ncbi:MAG TPA: cytochrome-c oxidase, cbb3-type subunit III [Bauldia sp.]|nr:cytochrome-c oxidase, cbb3-type subunit III [Bauldia sp.]